MVREDANIGPMNSERVLSWDTLAPAAQLQLLGNSFMRVRDGCTVMPLLGLPGLAWLYSLGLWPPGITLWWGASLLLVGAVWGVWGLWQRALKQRDSHDAATLLAVWLPRVQALAALYGALVMSSAASAGPDTPFELRVVFICGSTLVVSAHAAHQSAALVVFKRFFFTSYAVSLLSVPYVFPDHWPYLLPMHLAFGVFFRNASISHQFFLSNVDLTERFRAAKGEAEQALAVKNQFLATASHDLRQPVHAMSLMVEAISLRNSDPVLRPLVTDLRTSMQAMNQLFNALLDLARLESGQPLGAKGVVDLNALLADVVRLFREQASLGGLALRLWVPRGGATVWAEPVLLRQALANLVQNAIRYTPQGKVLVSVRARGSDWLVEVRDTGVGITVADQYRVFSPYYRGERADQMNDAGHGLGLAVVARCAEQMGATHGRKSVV